MNSNGTLTSTRPTLGGGETRGHHARRIRSKLCSKTRRGERRKARKGGVVGLANDLEVWLPGVDERPDPEIAQDAVAELKTWLPDAWHHVQPAVEHDWVTLEGEVEWNYQRDYAERALH